MLLCFALFLIGCHLVFPFEAPAPAPDTRDDVGADADAAPDGKIRKGLVCTPPVEVGTNPPSPGLLEPAIYVDGLKLVASGHNSSSIYYTERAELDPDKPFGPWKPTATFPNAPRDLTFFHHQGQTHMVTAVGHGSGKPRTLQICQVQDLSQSPSCKALQVEVDGELVTDDTDGPTVRIFRDEPVMVHNISPMVNGTVAYADIYFARPQTSDMEIWTATKVPLLGKPEYLEDDPTISVDHGLLVYALIGNDISEWTLRVASSFSEAAPYVYYTEPVEGLAGLAGNQADPELYQLPSGELELYLTGEWPDAPKIYRCLCHTQ